MNLAAWLDNRRADLRFALRMTRKTPGATAIAVLSLALGIGANTAIFSLVDVVLLRLLPVKAPHELYMVEAGSGPRKNNSWNYPDYVAFRDRNHSFTDLAAASFAPMPLGMQAGSADAASPAELTHVSIVSGNYFDTLGVRPEIGRLFTPMDDQKPGAAPYIVVSHRYWMSRFNADPGVIGKTLRLNGFPLTVIGVSGRGFRGTDLATSPDMFVPIMMRSEMSGTPYTRWNTRRHWWMLLVGRIKPGATVKQAESELSVFYRDQEEAERKLDPKRGGGEISTISLAPAAGGYSNTRNRLEKPLQVLMGVVGLVLLIACANVANLMLARGAARQREIAVRLAVGASRSRLIGQLLMESLVIALLGGAAGLLLAYFGTGILLRFVPKVGWAPVQLNVSPDFRLIAFTGGISILTGILFGLAPALKSTKPDLLPALKEDVPGSTGSGSRWNLRNGLVVLQVALSLLLLCGSGLFIRSLGNLRNVDTGFRSDRFVTVSIEPERHGYKGQRIRDFLERLRENIATLPGVQSVALSQITPLGGSRWNSSFSAEGYEAKAGDRNVIDMNAVGPRYFETAGIPIVAGRDFRDDDNPPFSVEPPATFTRSEDRPTPPGPRVAILTESAVQKYFAGRNPIGLHIAGEEKLDPAKAFEVIGVVKDAHYFGLKKAVEPMMYLPLWRMDAGAREICIRTSGNAGSIVEAVRRQITALDPAIPILHWTAIENQIDADIVESRLIATLSAFFGVLALLLAAVGLYGVISYTVTRRTRELGIRMALGAQRGNVLWLVLRDAGVLVIAGALIGVPTALALSTLVRSFLYGVSPQDPWIIVAGVVTLSAAAAFASFLPARRASSVDPITALRQD